MKSLFLLSIQANRVSFFHFSLLWMWTSTLYIRIWHRGGKGLKIAKSITHGRPLIRNCELFIFHILYNLFLFSKYFWQYRCSSNMYLWVGCSKISSGMAIVVFCGNWKYFFANKKKESNMISKWRRLLRTATYVYQWMNAFWNSLRFDIWNKFLIRHIFFQLIGWHIFHEI